MLRLSVGLCDRPWELGSVGQMITETIESLQLTQAFKHEPSVPVINTKAHLEMHTSKHLGNSFRNPDTNKHEHYLDSLNKMSAHTD